MQRRPDEKADEEIAESDVSPQPSPSGNVIPETQHTGTSNGSSEDESVKQQIKRMRPSKKEIPDYHWTQEAETRLAELVKESPCLYDKKEKEWLNVAAKSSRWNRVGEQIEPPATGPQCKKYYENMRTRLGKIVKRESKSGAGQPERTVRDDEILQTWSFLKQHIVRGETISSDQFAVPAVAISDEDDEMTSSPSRKAQRKRPATTTADTEVAHSELSEAVKQIIGKADALETQSHTGQQKIVHDFACLLEGHMQSIPEESWHGFEIDCLNLAHRYRQRQQQWPVPQQQQFWNPVPQQQQQAPTWMPPRSPQYPWTRATVDQTPSPTPSMASLSAVTFKTPMKIPVLSFPELDTPPPVHQVSSGSSASTSKDTE